jgi:hypothetical protein
VKQDEIGKAHSTHGVRWNAYRDLVGKPVGRPRCKFENNIEMDVWEVGWGDTGWIHVEHDRDQ